jgi:hypothetical protein
MVKPIFIFSLPRSGSTLLQRTLTVHKRVASTSEPWILLPIFYGFKGQGIYTEYAQFGAHRAFEDVVSALPDGIKDIHEAVRLYAVHVYSRLAQEKGASFFVDKTPRYHLIADEIIQAFPDAKFIFLWRNPLAVVSSIVETWDGDYWTPFKYKVDLYKGLEKLIETYEKHSDKSLAVRYEDLLLDPEQTMGKVCEYIGLDFRQEMLSGIGSVQLQGRMGDPTGVKQYQQLSAEPLEKWKRSICNPYRKYWCKRYLEWVGEKRMAAMGYKLQDELRALDALKVTGKYLIGDLLIQAYGLAYCTLEPRLYKDKLKTKWEEVVIHG